MWVSFLTSLQNTFFQNESPTQVFSCEFCKTFKSIIFTEDLWRLLLCLWNIFVISKTIILVRPFKTSKIRKVDAENQTSSRRLKWNIFERKQIWCLQGALNLASSGRCRLASSIWHESDVFKTISVRNLLPRRLIWS